MENNLEYDVLFDAERKAEAFDKIAELFYNKNFSTLPKSEIDLLMFHFYMDALLDNYSVDKGSGKIDFNACSDHRIAQQLGITPQKARNLKVKSQARYPREYDWKKALASLKDRVRYDEQKKKIVIPMPDPNLYEEVSNFIEENGGFIEVQRSGNYIQIRPEYYIFLIYESVDENKQKLILRELQEKNGPLPVSQDDKVEMINHVLSMTDNGLAILASLIDKIDSPLTMALKGIRSFLELKSGCK